MIFPKTPIRTGLAASVGLAAMLLAAPSLAQNAPAPSSVDSVKLLELLVENGAVTRAQADRLIAEATVAPPPVPVAAAPMAAPEAGSQRVQYIPEVVRLQIKDELRAEVTAQARSEGWAQPGLVPDWVQNVELTGDVRVRGEGVFQDDENGFTFADFNAINTGTGFDISANGPNAPLLNTSEDRQRARIRARLGLKARISDGILAEVRVATGNDSSPVSTNQTLGSGGYFSKYDLWLDRANIQLSITDEIGLTAGRFANPFWTTGLLFDEDLNFDGVALSYAGDPEQPLSVFGSVGAFPIFNTDFNFGDRGVPDVDDPQQFESRDQYLLAAQIGASMTRERFALKGALGYFNFIDAQGELSSPCFAPTELTVCDGDASRVGPVQFGNTVFAIRDIVVDPANPNGPQLQYFGRAAEFEVVNAHVEAGFDLMSDTFVRLTADAVYNLGFEDDDIGLVAVNNRGPSVTIPDPDNPAETIDVDGPFDGGEFGWMVEAALGARDLAEFADWRVSVGYRYLESDAVIDSFSDSDFHLGGTNAQGFTVGGEFALARNAWLSARWLSANEVSGPPYANDIIQLDLNAKF